MAEYPKVVILNDTRPDLHHGCSRVMRILEQELASRRLKIIARSPLRHDWSRDPYFLEKIRIADLIVINGEGTLHHGTRHGEILLSIAEHSYVKNTPIALVNALYQDNPQSWGRLISQMALVSARDQQSAAQLGQAMGQAPTRYVPDLSLSETIQHEPPLNGVVWGDSVKKDVADFLADQARRKSQVLCPTLATLKRPKGNNPLHRALRRWWIQQYEKKYRQKNSTFVLAKNEAEYSRILAGALLHVTGRFHGVCYSLAARRPFLAIESNSNKISSLISDIGLEPWRVGDMKSLCERIADGAEAVDYQPHEFAALTKFLDDAALKTSILMDDLAALANRG